jgi:putative membrane protein
MQSEVELATRPRRTHPATVALGVFWLGVGALLALAGGGLFDLALQAFGVFTIAGWWFRTYEVKPDELVVRDGVLNRKTHIVPYRRVQQIDVRRSLIMQLFGLAELRIETAGSQAGKVLLRVLAVRTAEELRAHMLARRGGMPVDPAMPGATIATGRSLVAIGGGRLALAAMTSTELVLVFVLAAALVLPSAALAIAVDPLFAWVTLGIMAIGLLMVVVAVIATTLNYGGYQLDVAGDELQLTRGVLDKQHVHVPRARVQHVTITDNPLRRALGLVSVHVRSAANVNAADGVSGRVDIPILDRAELVHLLPHLMGDLTATVPVLEPRPDAAKQRGIVRRTALLLVPALVTLVAFPPAGVVAVVFALAAGLWWGRVAHARAGYAVTGPLITFAAGVLRHEIHFVPVRRVQSARTWQSPFQRVRALSTIGVDIAGSRFAPSLYDCDEAVARGIRQTLPRASRTHSNDW